MKTTATKLENKDTKHEYPLLVTDGNCVVFAMGDCDGVMIHTGEGTTLNLGYIIDQDRSYFDSWRKYEGVITLENN